MTCETCKHLREVKDLRDRDGSPLTLHYCHAISSFPYRTPDYPACKKWSANPDKILSRKPSNNPNNETLQRI